MAWNRTRRQITRDLDTKIANFREELLNDLLTAAWDSYVKALDDGTLIQLEDAASGWVDRILNTQLRPQLEGIDGDLDNG